MTNAGVGYTFNPAITFAAPPSGTTAQGLVSSNNFALVAIQATATGKTREEALKNAGPIDAALCTFKKK